uniref:Uncharacterized protein n=1 Tax=Chromera velia CCMP2878 TaxID=1169474 RepID=A0A0G4HEC9_9ALVE|eukprot:Cvel_26616.t1-p1 / transcript=Cvel_26616.t1 / gene=Cvel_26616 / organism=Chromera_velia_CCMP2878 / gene_product=hypothetical protein / transcript_product=hypothetical protein / location=Cvel_scaffold3194:11058-11939(+) / protein_length=145 / sequence_SO=supercontig / SO=protein_coding / is_pseudo=false
MAARALVVSLNIDGGICVIWLPGEGTPLATTEFALSPEPIDVDLLFPTEVVGAAPPNILVPACAALEATIRTHMEGLKAAGLFFWKEVSFDVDPSTWEANYVASVFLFLCPSLCPPSSSLISFYILPFGRFFFAVLQRLFVLLTI